MLRFLLDNAIGMITIILAINIVYVTLFTIRMIFTLKGQRYFAALTSIIEVIIYILTFAVRMKKKQP